MLKPYLEFLKNKRSTNPAIGFYPPSISPQLYDFQKAIVRWACRKGMAAIFADCGLGKTPIQLEWARLVHEHTKGNVLILAPLAVSYQTQREGEKFGIVVNICKGSSDIKAGINITNYERLDKFDPSSFIGIVLDESSILKSFSGKIRNQIIKSFATMPYKLACTATPAPNDYMELGNHAEFLNAMTRAEMLAMFFIHDGSDTAKWRLKGHVKDNVFWEWMASWSIMLRKPSDLGYDDDRFVLPELKYYEHFVENNNADNGGYLFPMKKLDLLGRKRARKSSIDVRIKKAVALINDEPWICWCDLNDESKKLHQSIAGAVEVTGSNKIDYKEKALLDFSLQKFKCLVSKPKIAGHGMNWQHCNNMVFVGLSDSYEALYQAIRRCWRFGQTKEVNVHIVLSREEGTILQNIKRKEQDHDNMVNNMVAHMKDITMAELNKNDTKEDNYQSLKTTGKKWTLFNGDCVEVTQKIDSESIDYTIFSPPFASLYTYSDSNRDMGNSKSGKEFIDHFKFLIKELFRITKAGRLVSIHCMDIPAMKERDGYIGLKDFPGELIRWMQHYGFIYHSKCIVWKDPLIEAVRTKSLGLMHKQIMKDSSRCRQGLPDYIITFMKPGENQKLIAHPDGFTYFLGENEPRQKGVEYSHNVWRRYASPVWADINQSNTLNKELAREKNDERHIAPLQLDVIARCIELWSNKNDVVFSPFAGIGSEGYQALKMKRRFVGVELKRSYFNVAIGHLRQVETTNQFNLFEGNNHEGDLCSRAISG